ncbi:MAG: MinD/ParA family protein [Fretibacterium sp.]|nr:MinD/ParA family protein [Fretibacterium sp.]
MRLFGASPLDQAGELRRLVEEQRKEKKAFTKLRTIAVLSGKGGVGKSNLSLALSCALADRDKRVVLLDADLGMANIDILSGVTSRYNLAHLIDGSRKLYEVLVPVEKNVRILPGGVGLKTLADLDDEALSEFINLLGELEESTDILILDTGAGIHKGVLSFAVAADTSLLVTTPEPTSIRDAYGVLKALTTSWGSLGAELVFVVNMARSEAEGRDVAGRIQRAAGRFLGVSVPYFGCVLRDRHVEQAVRLRNSFFRLYPACYAAEGVRHLVDGLLGESKGTSESSRGLKAFFFRLTRGSFAGK